MKIKWKITSPIVIWKKYNSLISLAYKCKLYNIVSSNNGITFKEKNNIKEISQYDDMGHPGEFSKCEKWIKNKNYMSYSVYYYCFNII